MCVEQVLQALDAVLEEVSPLPELTLKLESSFWTLPEAHAGHFTFLLEELEQSTSNILPHLRHSYSNIGKQITPTC